VLVIRSHAPLVAAAAAAVVAAVAAAAVVTGVAAAAAAAADAGSVALVTVLGLHYFAVVVHLPVLWWRQGKHLVEIQLVESQ